jgi:hypothetical protein
MELALHVYVLFLLAIGEIGFGWLLVSRSQGMVSFFSSGKKSRFVARMLAISGSPS